MITGDHAVTAGAIAHQLGIEGRAMTGAEFRAMSDDEAIREIDGIGVIARVSPEDKVHLVDILRKKGHVVGMTGDGVNDAPALKKADIGIAMGITGTEVSKQAAVMILTDDNYATIVKAVGLGRAVYDNLLRFIRFQMVGLFGFIGTFLGASLLNILSGIPFLPLQTMWLNFTVNVFQAIGLGYGKPREGLMAVPPRPKDAEDHPAAADALAGGLRPRHRRRHARRPGLGGRRLRRCRRADDGRHDVRSVPPLLLARDRGRGRVRVQRVHPVEQPAPHRDGDLGAVDHPRDRARVPPADPGDGQPVAGPVGRLHPGRALDHRRRGGSGSCSRSGSTTTRPP